MRQVLAGNSLGEREENSLEGRGSSTGKGTESLKEENYTLRNELQRLATEVASLKTILLPVSPSSSPGSSGLQQLQQESFSSPSPSIHNHHEDQEEPQDQEMDTSSEKGSTSTLDD